VRAAADSRSARARVGFEEALVVDNAIDDQEWGATSRTAADVS
jgi:hypothetical protein